MKTDSDLAQFNRALVAEFPGIAPVTIGEYREMSLHRRSGEDRRKSVQNLVLAARMAEKRLADLGDAEGAELLRMAIEGAQP